MAEGSGLWSQHLLSILLASPATPFLTSSPCIILSPYLPFPHTPPHSCFHTFDTLSSPPENCSLQSLLELHLFLEAGIRYLPDICEVGFNEPSNFPVSCSAEPHDLLVSRHRFAHCTDGEPDGQVICSKSYSLYATLKWGPKPI